MQKCAQDIYRSQGLSVVIGLGQLRGGPLQAHLASPRGDELGPLIRWGDDKAKVEGAGWNAFFGDGQAFRSQEVQK